jgi:hypothetical protein
MSLIKLFLGGNNLVFSRPERVWSVTSRLGTGKWLTLFYSALVERIPLLKAGKGETKLGMRKANFRKRSEAYISINEMQDR